MKTAFRIVILLILAFTALVFASCEASAEDGDAADTDTVPTPTPIVVSQPSDEAPGSRFAINDERIHSIEIIQPVGRWSTEQGKSNPNPASGTETTLVVTFYEPLIDAFRGSFPLSYVSVYRDGEFLMQNAARGDSHGNTLVYSPKNNVDSFGWAPGMYSFELFIEDGEDTMAAMIAVMFQESGNSAGWGETPDGDEPPDLPGDKDPLTIKGQDKVMELTYGEEIYFAAEVFDVLDGKLRGDEVKWTLETPAGSGSREFMTGSLLRVLPYELAPGSYIFTCTATNKRGDNTEKDFKFSIVMDDELLPDGWSRKEIGEALSKGISLPLDRLDASVTRGQFAGLMAGFFFALPNVKIPDPEYDQDAVKDCGFDGYDQFLMVDLGVMGAPGGFFDPNKSLTEEEAAMIMAKAISLTIKDFFGADDEAGIIEILKDYGVFPQYGPDAYKAREKLTNRLAMIRISRLYDAVFSNELRIIAKGFKPYECDDAASAMRAAMKKSEKEGAVISMYFSGNAEVYTEGQSMKKTMVSTTGFHVGVLFAGRVHCNIYPAGLPEAEWRDSFYERSGKMPRIEYLPV